MQNERMEYERIKGNIDILTSMTINEIKTAGLSLINEVIQGIYDFKSKDKPILMKMQDGKNFVKAVQITLDRTKKLGEMLDILDIENVELFWNTIYVYVLNNYEDELQNTQPVYYDSRYIEIELKDGSLQKVYLHAIDKILSRMIDD